MSATAPPRDLSRDLGEATARGEIEVFYQPLVRLASGTLEGFEALARWHHPRRGMISPATFIPMAEETGAINDIGRLVLMQACRQVAAWNSRFGVGLRISVNVSPVQLAKDGLVPDVLEALDSSGLRSDQLTLELTETAPVHDLATIGQRLQELRVLGVRVALDDFGTGYASLDYLRFLPLDVLKLDKCLVDDDRAVGLAVLTGLVGLGTAMGLDTVAEGIELPEQLTRAREAGVTFGQGFLLARPMDAEAGARFVADQPSGARA